MSGTFTQPSSPTAGLQSYDLERKPKRLTPEALGFTLSAARTKAARRKPNHVTTHSPDLKKDSRPMREIIEAMTGTLSKSVSDLIASNPSNLDEMLAKNFSEFNAAIEDVVDDEMSKMATPEGDPLFKGMGTVGRMVRLAHHVHREAKHIKDGCDHEGGDVDDDCPDHVSDMLDHMTMAADIGMHHAVNSHVGIMDDDEGEEDLPPGMHMIQVPAYGSNGHIIAKTDLPADLIKFIIDPAAVEEAAITLGTSMLMQAGISEPALEKLFRDDSLAKGFPPAKKKPAAVDDGADDGDDRSGADDGSAMDDGSDDGEDGGSDPSMGGGADGSDMGSPLDVAQRLAAALMIQLSHIQEILEGGAGGMGAPAAGADPTDPDPEEEEEDEEEDPAALQRASRNQGLNKRDLNDLVEAQVAARVEAELAALRPALEKALALPAEAKGYVGPAYALTKGEDASGHLAKTAESEADELAKLSPDERAVALTKMAYRNPKSELPGR